MPRKFQVGIIGYGGFGQYLHQAWGGHPGVVVAAVADADPARRPSPGSRFYHQWQDLLNDPEIDIVTVATPCSSHAEIAVAALRRGKHVLVEKPLATTLEGAREIIAARDASGCVAAVDYMQRYNPLVQAVKALCDNDTLGILRRIVVENYAADDQLPPHHWFWDLERSGGILVEHGVHFFDLADYLSAATPVQVNGSAARRPDGRIDRMQASVQYDTGLLAEHYHAFCVPGYFEQTTIRLVFDLARIELTGWIPLQGRITALTADGSIDTFGWLPNFETISRTPIKELTDESRPEGWGQSADEAEEGQETVCGGKNYNVDLMIEGRFRADGDKHTVYIGCLRALQSDFLAAVRGDGTVNVPLEHGLQSLDTALKATALALATLPPSP
ncbi:MAG: Gfo/Idh/MocA family oxidoreductase [Candidatus Neomarinimicrobiota bacterium]